MNHELISVDFSESVDLVSVDFIKVDHMRVDFVKSWFLRVGQMWVDLTKVDLVCIHPSNAMISFPDWRNPALRTLTHVGHARETWPYAHIYAAVAL